MATLVKLPTLPEANRWFVEKIIPRRTTNSGFSPNRVWKGPRGIVMGNTEDPNGLCGDAAIFVFEQFFADFGDYRTRDGHQIGLVLWDGLILNHIANVMLVEGKVSPQTYEWTYRATWPHLVGGKGEYRTTQLLSLTVYDLYYKKGPMPLAQWWSDRDAARRGSVRLCLPSDAEG